MGSAVSVMAPVWGRAAWLRMSSSGENLSDHDLFPADPTRNEPYRQRLRGGGLPAGSHLRASTTARLRVRLAAPGGRRMALRPGQPATPTCTSSSSGQLWELPDPVLWPLVRTLHDDVPLRPPLRYLLTLN